MADVFVSYDSEDRERIKPLVDALEAKGWSVWWDRQLRPGPNFAKTIRRELDAARCVVVAWSKYSVESDWCLDEANEGLQRGILVPARIDDVPLPLGFGQAYTASLIGWPRDTRGLEELVFGIQVCLDPTDDLSLNEASDSVSQEDSTAWYINSKPAGARVAVQPYRNRASSWREVGATPISALLMPNGIYRVRLELDGYAPVEMLEAIPGYQDPFVGHHLHALGLDNPPPICLQTNANTPDGMVFVVGGALPVNLQGYSATTLVDCGAFFIDRDEVTNEEFSAFVEAGGYADEQFWEDIQFVRDNAMISLSEAKSLMIDKTGRPGPKNWRFGTYPEDEARLPVAGVSWYEAVAYARFAGKELPTAIHWSRAARGYLGGILGDESAMIRASNFGGQRVAPVRETQAVGVFGVADMAGNVREWVRNETETGRRAVLGGSYADPDWMFVITYDLDPLTRDGFTGFRCIRRIDPSKEEDHLDEPIWTASRIACAPPPIDDTVYDVLRTQLEYEPQPAASNVTTLLRTDRITYERIDLAYPSAESLTVYVLRPLKMLDALQAVLLVPGAGEFASKKTTDVLNWNPSLNQLVTDSGRALVWPVMYGSNERFAGVASTLTPGEHPLFFRDAQYEWRKDIGRTIDYLGTRDDIDSNKMAYFGISYGTSHPLPAVSQESRLKALILVGGGLINLERPPIATMSNFLPHIKVPVLMINGRYDHALPYQESQVPMFNLLGTPRSEKTHFVLDSGHGMTGEVATQAYLKAMDWLDDVLGAPT